MACSEIRDNVRSSVQLFRQFNRDKALGSKRKALADFVDLGRDVTDAEVVLIANKLKSKSSVQVADLALLKIAFVQNTKNMVAFLRVKGALHALVRELSSMKSNFQLVAAECCCNLALGDAKTCFQVAKAAGPYLISMLSGSNLNLISVSIWALGNLMGSDEKTWNVLHAQGLLEKLLKLMELYDDTKTDVPMRVEVHQNSLMALVQLLYLHFNKIWSSLLSEEEVKTITSTLGNLKQTSGKGLWISTYLLTCIGGVAEKEMMESNMIEKCLIFMEKTDLADETVSSFTHALRTIANLISEDSGVCCLQVFSHWNLLQDTVQKIFSSPYPHLVKELGWLLGNLLNHPSPEVQCAVAERSFDFQLYESQFAFFSQ